MCGPLRWPRLLTDTHLRSLQASSQPDGSFLLSGDHGPRLHGPQFSRPLLKGILVASKSGNCEPRGWKPLCAVSVWTCTGGEQRTVMTGSWGSQALSPVRDPWAVLQRHWAPPGNARPVPRSPAQS